MIRLRSRIGAALLVCSLAAASLWSSASAAEKQSEPAIQDGRAFQLYDNYDIVGGISQTISAPDVGTFLIACQRESQCVGFGFDKWKKLCTLKVTASSLRFDPSRITGLPNAGPAPPSADSPFRIEHLPRTAFSGTPYRTLPENSANDCQNACTNEQNCVAFTHVTTNRICRLYSTTDGFNEAADAEAGFKRQLDEAENSSIKTGSAAQDKQEDKQDIRNGFSTSAIDAVFYARHNGVVVRAAPSLMATGVEQLKENIGYTVTERLVPKQSGSDEQSWYAVKLDSEHVVFASGEDVFNDKSYKTKLVYDQVIPKLDELLERAQSENSGPFARHWGIYSNNVENCQAGMAALQWLVWFQGRSMRAVILNSPLKEYSGELKLVRSFRSNAGTINWYSFTDVTLAFFGGELLTDPKFVGTTVHYVHKPKCQFPAVTIRAIQDTWRKIVHDLPTEKEGE